MSHWSFRIQGFRGPPREVVVMDRPGGGSVVRVGPPGTIEDEEQRAIVDEIAESSAALAREQARRRAEGLPLLDTETPPSLTPAEELAAHNEREAETARRIREEGLAAALGPSRRGSGEPYGGSER